MSDELSGGNVELSGRDLVTSVAGASAMACKTTSSQSKRYIVKLLGVSFAKFCANTRMHGVGKGEMCRSSMTATLGCVAIAYKVTLCT